MTLIYEAEAPAEPTTAPLEDRKLIQNDGLRALICLWLARGGVVAAPGQAVRALCSRMGLDAGAQIPGPVHHTLRSLASDGIVELGHNEGQSRIARILLTQKGRKMFESELDLVTLESGRAYARDYGLVPPPRSAPAVVHDSVNTEPARLLLKELQGHVTAVAEFLGATLDDYGAAGADVVKLQAQVADLQAEARQHEKDMSAVTGVLSGARVQCENLEMRVTALTAALASKEGELAAAKDELGKTKRRLTDATASRDKHHTEKDKHADEIKRLRGELAEFEAKFATIATALSTVNS